MINGLQAAYARDSLRRSNPELAKAQERINVLKEERKQMYSDAIALLQWACARGDKAFTEEIAGDLLPIIFMTDKQKALWKSVGVEWDDKNQIADVIRQQRAAASGEAASSAADEDKISTEQMDAILADLERKEEIALGDEIMQEQVEQIRLERAQEEEEQEIRKAEMLSAFMTSLRQRQDLRKEQIEQIYKKGDK